MGTAEDANDPGEGHNKQLQQGLYKVLHIKILSWKSLMHILEFRVEVSCYSSKCFLEEISHAYPGLSC